MTRKKWNRLRRQYPVLTDLPSWEFIGRNLRRYSRQQVVAAVLACKLTGKDTIELAGCWAINTTTFVPLPKTNAARDMLDSITLCLKSMEKVVAIDLALDGTDKTVRTIHHVQTQ